MQVSALILCALSVAILTTLTRADIRDFIIPEPEYVPQPHSHGPEAQFIDADVAMYENGLCAGEPEFVEQGGILDFGQPHQNMESNGPLSDGCIASEEIMLAEKKLNEYFQSLRSDLSDIKVQLTDSNTECGAVLHV